MMMAMPMIDPAPPDARLEMIRPISRTTQSLARS